MQTTRAIVLAAALMWPLVSATWGAGLKGGRSGGGGRPGAARAGGGGGGGPRPGGGHGSAPNLGGGGARPSMPRPQMNRPSGGGVSRPSPIAHGGAGGGIGGRPGFSNMGGGMKPNISRPQIGSRPGGPGARPGGGAGSSLGLQRPGGGAGPNPGLQRPGGGSSPNLGMQRPGGRPGAQFPGGRPGANDRPIATLPNRPGAGPGTRPGPSNRPAPGDFLGLDRPTPRPGFRPGGGDRPIAGGGTRPEFPGGDIRPGRPGGGDNRPGRPGDISRPGAGGSGEQWRPGDNRPGRPGDNVRPGGGGSGEQWRPGERPWRPGGNNRPDWANRPGNRPGWNDRGGWNHGIINNRPSWVNVNNINNVNIQNRWNNAFLATSNSGWWNRAGVGRDQWANWGNGVRNNWYQGNYGNEYFTNNWWNNHYDSLGGWHYGYQFNQYPASYWWSAPQWGALSSWFTWNNAPQTVWAQPVYYDYGPNGNVTYNNNVVSIGGQPIASAESYAMSAAELATVPAPATEQEAEAAQWMPLGTFAVSTSQQDVDPGRVLQLAVSKTGIVSGTLYNSTTDVAQSVLGHVDPATQRVAFRVGENENVVVETGLGNLSQNEAAALVHYGPTQQETWLLVRLDNPDSAPPRAAL